MSANPYGDPRALRLAVADRLRPLARDRAIPLSSVQRQFAYDRLLCRVFSADPERWVLKGATAMLARLGGHARHTRDIDLLSRTGSLDEAERALRAAAAVDFDDYFSFTLSPGRQIAQGAGAVRVNVVAFLGLREFARFHVDLVADLVMTGTPDTVSPLVPLDLPGLVSASYRAYPLADHLADKVCALLELHERSSGLKEPSTRFRDLADLAIFARTVIVDAAEVAVALSSEAERRGLTLPDRLATPTGRDWPRGYARVARDVPHLRERDLPSALATVGLFIDPVLAGKARGRWDLETLRWHDPRAAPALEPQP
ncbi:MAG TPA: nucleotidyl transferase AbiEii/AbiGii toxin family protein [Solirubrobacteraceae bacterium]|nr:nucleotidyl transferase AbiEii/AbiGii toxin family protein [Solirubrobacteraceae bacterium]